MAKVRVALAQIDFFPAYLTVSANWLQEPSGDYKDGFNQIRSINDSIQKFCTNIEKEYLEIITEKIKACLELAAGGKADIIIFPEYSIPPYLLPQLDEFAKSNNIIIIAGTHVVNANAENSYTESHIAVSLSGTESDIRKAVCPIITPGQNYIIKKQYRSKWETDIVTESQERKSIEVEVNGKRFNILVMICIEAIRLTANYTDNLLLVVPAWSPSTAPFEDICSSKLLNELPSVFANTAKIGDSKIFAQFVGDNLGMTDEKFTKPINKDCEAIVIADIDLELQFQKKQSAVEHLPAQLVSYIPILYLDSAALTKVQLECDKISAGNYNNLPVIQNKIWKAKMNYLSQAMSNGGLRQEDVAQILSYLPLGTNLNLDSFRFNNLQQAFAKISSLMPNLSPDHLAKVPDILKNLSMNLSKYTKHQEQSNEDSKPFFDREDLIPTVNNFFNSKDERVVFIKGIRGIGKTAFLSQIFKKVLPEARWTKCEIRLTPGTGIVRFLSQLVHVLRADIKTEEIEQIYNNNKDYTPIIDKLMAAFNTYSDACLVIYDWQYVLNQSGHFIHNGFREFFDCLCSSSGYQGNKIILVGTRSFALEYKANPIRLFPMSDEYIKAILDFHIRSIRGGNYSFDSTDLVPNLHGHPMAAILAAQQVEKISLQEIISNPEIYNRFRELLVEYLLEGIEIPEDQLSLAKFLSVLNVPATLSLITNLWGTEAYNTLSSLIDRFIVGINDQDEYWLHPLLKKHFYRMLTKEERLILHDKVAQYYEGLCLANNSPENIGETVSHFSASLNLNKALQFKSSYASELRPMALELYKRGDYSEAIKYYIVLSKMQDDVDVEYRLAVSYVRVGDIRLAHKHFNKALEIDPKAWWVYSGFAYALVTHSRTYRNEAESLALKSEEIAEEQRISKLEKARIKTVFGKVREKDGDIQGAENFYLESIKDNPGHMSGYMLIIKLYRNKGRLEEAMIQVQKGLASNPKHPLLLKIQKEIKLGIEETDEDMGFVEES
ncbi:tetratricopeptide repeat protein [Sporomusa sp. KB1]|jgi:tetratricopeptide (TPR) repeat protein|uniref:tetratricopeptide repeat protein n=1 Tax=Sporomusa sp. KB1 TaxID=943346 RepID=UPI0011A1671D|nr:tetratricopeptide repeat protein [Sporomusa sp. KB1]TWH47968.1 putative amidohydrolase [Sporomusa sp. KB1]